MIIHGRFTSVDIRYTSNSSRVVLLVGPSNAADFALMLLFAVIFVDTVTVAGADTFFTRADTTRVGPPAAAATGSTSAVESPAETPGAAAPGTELTTAAATDTG